MKRCNHSKIHIIEYGTALTYHDREEDGYWSNVSDVGHYTGAIDVKCDDCKLDRTYYRSNTPNWLKQYLEDMRLQSGDN